MNLLRIRTFQYYHFNSSFIIIFASGTPHHCHHQNIPNLRHHPNHHPNLHLHLRLLPLFKTNLQMSWSFQHFHTDIIKFLPHLSIICTLTAVMAYFEVYHSRITHLVRNVVYLNFYHFVILVKDGFRSCK